MNPTPRAEPRRMSLTDLMVVVAGWAVGYSLQPFSTEWIQAYNGASFFEYDSLFLTLRRPLLILAFSLAAVIVVRLARYARMPRLAEWPALEFAVALVVHGVLDTAYPLAWAGLFLHLNWIDWHERGLWPELILFGVPIVAGLRDRLRPRHRPGIWTEWIGLVLGLVLAACWLLGGFALGSPMDPAHVGNLIVRGLWLVVIGLAIWLMLNGYDGTRREKGRN